MSVKMRKPGRIKEMNLDLYLEVLQDRLANEEKGFLRKYIRAKIKMVRNSNGKSSVKKENRRGTTG
jgi:hypothetical protein